MPLLASHLAVSRQFPRAKARAIYNNPSIQLIQSGHVPDFVLNSRGSRQEAAQLLHSLGCLDERHGGVSKEAPPGALAKVDVR